MKLRFNKHVEVRQSISYYLQNGKKWYIFSPKINSFEIIWIFLKLYLMKRHLNMDKRDCFYILKRLIFLCSIRDKWVIFGPQLTFSEIAPDDRH